MWLCVLKFALLIARFTIILELFDHHSKPFDDKYETFISSVECEYKDFSKLFDGQYEYITNSFD